MLSPRADATLFSTSTSQTHLTGNALNAMTRLNFVIHVTMKIQLSYLLSNAQNARLLNLLTQTDNVLMILVELEMTQQMHQMCTLLFVMNATRGEET